MRATVRRFAENPILIPSQLAPSRPDFEVVGVFNPGVIRIGDETLLLLRVAEAPLDVPEHHVAAPIYDADTQRIVIRTWPKDTPFLDTSDSRLISVGNDTFLTSISHFRRARAKDGFSSRSKRSLRFPRPRHWKHSGWKIRALRALATHIG